MSARKFYITGVVLLLFLSFSMVSGCSPKIKGWSQESFRDPGFQNGVLLHDNLALFPVMIVEAPGEKSGKLVEISPPAPYTADVRRLEVSSEQKSSDPHELYQIILDEMLLNRLHQRNPGFKLVTQGEVLKRINDKGMIRDYETFNRTFVRVGLNEELIREFGEVLGCRYLLISQGMVTESKSEATYTLVWTFGRKSTLRTVKISSQLWDTQGVSLVWEGSGVGYNQLSLYEGAPLLEEMASQAVDRLLDAMIPMLPGK
jgi:hypothetical protein